MLHFLLGNDHLQLTTRGAGSHWRPTLEISMKLAALIASVVLPTAASAQYYQPGQPYQPPPAHYRSTLPSWVPPTVPAGDPSLRIPMPPYPPPPPPQPYRWQP